MVSMTDNTRATPPHGRLWHIRRGSNVKGPFTAAVIKRQLLLGRIRAGDQVSRDGESWLDVALEPTFAAAPGGAPVPGCEDERSGYERRSVADAGESGRRAGPDRRRAEPAEAIDRRRRRSRVFASLQPPPRSRAAPVLAALLALALLAAAGYSLRPPPQGRASDCGASAAPGVNWDGCRFDGAALEGADLRAATMRSTRMVGVRLPRASLQGVDLAYADLAGADLSYADLGAATLRGASLQAADLAYARLRQADLSYADLRGAVLGGADLQAARLDHAIWPDGRICAAGSNGACL